MWLLVLQRSSFVYCGFRLRRAVYDLSFVSPAITLSFTIPVNAAFGCDVLPLLLFICVSFLLVCFRIGIFEIASVLGVNARRVSRFSGWSSALQVFTGDPCLSFGHPASSSDQWVSGGGLFGCSFCRIGRILPIYGSHFIPSLFLARTYL